MKIYKYLMAAAVIASIGTTSCKEGQYWDEMANPGEVYSFAKPNVLIQLSSTDEVPSSYDVTVSRNIAGPAVTIPVAFGANSTVLTGPENVTFAEGEYTATYTISIDAAQCSVGDRYEASLAIDQPDEANQLVDENNLVFNFALLQDFNWVSAGTCIFQESLFGGYAEGVVIENAADYPSDEYKLYRLVNPFETMFEGDSDVSEANILYVLDNDKVPVAMYRNFQFSGMTYQEEDFYFGIVPSYGGYFSNQGALYTMSGLMATVDATGSVSPAYYETFQFIWSDYDE